MSDPQTSENMSAFDKALADKENNIKCSQCIKPCNAAVATPVSQWDYLLDTYSFFSKSARDREQDDRYDDSYEDFFFNENAQEWTCKHCTFTVRYNSFKLPLNEYMGMMRKSAYNMAYNPFSCYNMVIPQISQVHDLAGNMIVEPCCKRLAIFFPYLKEAKDYNRWIGFFNNAVKTVNKEEFGFVEALDLLNSDLHNDKYPNAYEAAYLRILIIKQYNYSGGGFFRWNAHHSHIKSYIEYAHEMFEQLEELNEETQLHILNTVCNDTVIPFEAWEWREFLFFFHQDYDMYDEKLYYAEDEEMPFLGDITMEPYEKENCNLPIHILRVGELGTVRDQDQQVAFDNKRYADIVWVDARVPKSWRVSSIRRMTDHRKEERAVYRNTTRQQTLFIYQFHTKTHIFNMPLGFCPAFEVKRELHYENTDKRRVNNKDKKAWILVYLSVDFVIRELNGFMKHIYQKNEPMKIDGIRFSTIPNAYECTHEEMKKADIKTVVMNAHKEPFISGDGLYTGEESNVAFFLADLGSYGLKSWRDNGHLIDDEEDLSSIHD